MNIDFSAQEVIFIYGHFKKQIRELENMKASPQNPISKTNINQDIKLFTAITDKIEAGHPQIRELVKHL